MSLKSRIQKLEDLLGLREEMSIDVTVVHASVGCPAFEIEPNGPPIQWHYGGASLWSVGILVPDQARAHDFESLLTDEQHAVWKARTSGAILLG